MLAKILIENGYLVRGIPNGAMALTAATSEPPDLILLDIMMPEMDGYEVCRQLKTDERTCEIPVIFMSALDEVMDKVKAFSVGGVDYITKPFQVEEVLARVKAHITLQLCKASSNVRCLRCRKRTSRSRRAMTSWMLLPTPLRTISKTRLPIFLMVG